MGNTADINMLNRGVKEWNQWIRNITRNPDLSQADLTGANLIGAFLVKANLNNVILADADIANANLTGAQLNGASLVGADLSHATLMEAQLEGTNLNHANLSHTNLKGASLVKVDLSCTSLSNSNLNDVNLTEANLYDADLTYADLTDADLTRANLQHVLIGGTKLANIDLSVAKGLDTIIHRGPSTVGIDTLYKSGGNIPDIFLQGCGVPDEFITYLPSLIGVRQALQFYSCFISYSHKDEEFSKRLHSRMRDAHLRVWFAPEDIKGGQKIHEQIDQAIQLHDRLLLVLSDNSLQSEWVMTEIRKARKIENKENRRKLFPIRLTDMETIREWECFDSDTGKDLAVEVREYYIPDFSNWKKHDSFEAAFDRLLRDLRAEELNQRRT